MRANTVFTLDAEFEDDKTNLRKRTFVCAIYSKEARQLHI